MVNQHKIKNLITVLEHMQRDKSNAMYVHEISQILQILHFLAKGHGREGDIEQRANDLITEISMNKVA